MCVCVYTHTYIYRERKSAFWDLSASVPLSYFYLNDLSPPSVCLYLARLRFCTVSFSPVGFLHWKGALAAAFPTLTETRLIVASDPPQGRRHLSTITAGALCSCLTLCDPMGCSPPGSSVHVTLQARILGWVAISSSRGSSWPRDWTCISCVSCIANGFFTHWATGKGKDSSSISSPQTAPCFPANISGYSGVSSLLRSMRHPVPSFCFTPIDTEDTCNCWQCVPISMGDHWNTLPHSFAVNVVYPLQFCFPDVCLYVGFREI